MKESPAEIRGDVPPPQQDDAGDTNHDPESHGQVNDWVGDKKWDEIKTFFSSSDITDEMKIKNVQYRNAAGENALHRACMWGASLEIIEYMFEKGGKDLIMAKDNRGYTALHWLCSCMHTEPPLEIIEILDKGFAF